MCVIHFLRGSCSGEHGAGNPRLIKDPPAAVGSSCIGERLKLRKLESLRQDQFSPRPQDGGQGHSLGLDESGHMW